MSTFFHSGTSYSQSLQSPMPYIQAAHAASEFDDDWVEDAVPFSPALGILTSMCIVFATAVIAWVGAQWIGW